MKSLHPAVKAVIGVTALTMLIIIANIASLRIAALLLALAALAGVFFWDRRNRRDWERRMNGNVDRLRDDYNRILRDVSRSRTDIELVRSTLSEAGAQARGYGRPDNTAAADQRMIRGLIEKLALLGAEQRDDIDLPAMDEWAGLNLHALDDKQILGLVRQALSQERIDLLLQPIVSLPQRKPRFYEMFSRIPMGPNAHLPAERYISLAAEAGILPAIDNLLLLHGLKKLAADPDASRGFFCNVTTLTLNDPKFMTDLVEFIAMHRSLAPRLVFEMSQRDIESMSAETRPILSGLARLGCRFSMDHVESISFDVSRLESMGIRFIKVDARLLISDIAGGDMMYLKRLKADLDRSGIDLIVSRVEHEKQLADISDLEIDFGQGYLFAKPELAV